ncbi:MAG: extracellular solute-binding protein [Oscillospiraceae bacterium]|jgi:putative aldouronate transport system substrate-binding protein|nr:extracellular solute-binding protein [Oscillospiraceae bacterium]
MKRFLSLALVAIMLLALIPAVSLAEAVSAENLAKYGLDETLKFAETRKITVEIYDRSVDDGPQPDDNMYVDFIKKGMLEKHNVEVEFVRVPRWTEGTDIANLLAAGSAPDICITYSMDVVNTYGQMGGVTDLAPFITDLEAALPNLFGTVGTELIWWNKDPIDGHLWCVEANRIDSWQQNTFVREDWLAKLGLSVPTTLQEFEDVLVAFRDNAELLLGTEAAKLIPFMFSYDVGFRWQPILDSLTPDTFTDRERFIYGSDDRKFLWPAAKETARVLNKWYNMGLCWNDFALYDATTIGTLEDDQLKAGYVGAFVHNSDYPYRNGTDSIHNALKRIIGEDAAFVSVNPFPNETGEVVRYAPAKASDRKIFFPYTNDEPVASLLYLDWISTFENTYFLQYGEEGVTHEVQENGGIKTIGVSGAKKMNSVNNIDYTITINGQNLPDPETKINSLALSYDNTDPRYVELFVHHYLDYDRLMVPVNVGIIEAQEGIGAELESKRNAILGKSISAPVDQFDAIWDSGVADYLQSGGQAIIDERIAKWTQFYGDVDFLQ